MPSRVMPSCLLGLTLALGASAPDAGASQNRGARAALRASFQPGRTSASVISVSNPTQRYAVHLPAAYAPSRKWPLLLLMDPRGRAMVPLERFREAADRRGYVLLSSYDTRSDTGRDVNSPAVRAMLADAPLLVSVDTSRVYLVGFSGTARTAWTFARTFDENIAGIIAFGGGLPLGDSAPWDAAFAHYGAAGWLDFNFDEMVRLDGNLALRGMDHAFESFPGGHQWGPADVCARAVDWMELMAMKSGRCPLDLAWVETAHDQRQAEAASLAATRPHAALLRARATLRDFAGLLPEETLAPSAELVDRIQANPAVQRATEARDQAVTRYYRYKRRLADLLDALESGSIGRDAPTLIEALELATLKEQAAAHVEDEADAIRARSARRLLEVVYVQCSFYLPRDYVREGKTWAAVLALEVADAVRPLDLDEVLDELGLESLRGEPTFQEWSARRER